jgi:hypothetical protein
MIADGAWLAPFYQCRLGEHLESFPLQHCRRWRSAVHPVFLMPPAAAGASGAA